MSILLVGLEEDLALVTARRLLAQDDEVRALVTEERAADAFRAAGVYVARGPDLDDPDLVERACQNVRTLVLGAMPPGSITHVLLGAGLAGVGRVVYVAARPGPEVEKIAAGDEYVILRLPVEGLLRKRTLDPSKVAEAIDAADDLGGTPRLDLDLAEDAAWRELRLVAP